MRNFVAPAVSQMVSGGNLALLAAAGFAAITIYVVHYSQSEERKVHYRFPFATLVYVTPSLVQRMRMGVERDVERQRRKEENLQLLRDQISLKRRLEEQEKSR